MRGRTYRLFYDGKRLRAVAWRTPRAVYWVSNTLSLKLTNKQMLGVARSLTRFGAPDPAARRRPPGYPESRPGVPPRRRHPPAARRVVRLQARRACCPGDRRSAPPAAWRRPSLLEVKDDVDIFTAARATSCSAEVKGLLDDVDPGEPQTLLLLGSDQRYIDKVQKNPTRSDTMILVRLDPSKGATAVMSIPRDLKVEIPGKGTDRVNAAYALGGPALTLRTVRSLLREGSPDGRFPIHHTVNINFGGFRRAVDRLDCVYVDVDRKYFNDNSGGGPDYAVIDVKAGYQKLCGQDALDYVRYRHFDNDLVRAARQQDFLRQAKDQIGLGKLFSDRKELLKIFGRYTQTDISGTTAVLRLIKLMVESAKNPIQEVQFQAHDGAGGYLEISEDRLRARVGQFLDAKAKGRSRAKPKKTATDKRRERSQRKRSKSQGVAGRPARRAHGRRGPRRAARREGPVPRLLRPLRRARLDLPARPTRAPTTSTTASTTSTAPTAWSSARPASASTTASRAPTGATRRCWTARRRHAATTGASTSCTSTARTCGWSPGAPTAPSTGSPTRCCSR